MLFENKKGERLFSLIWILVLAVVGVGIVSGISIFFSADLDMRQIESDSLYWRIVGCVVPDYLNQEVLEKDFDILDVCNFNPEVVKEGGEIYFELNFSDKDGRELREIIFAGEPALKEEFMLTKVAEKADAFARGVEREEEFFYYNKDNELRAGKVEILVATNMEGKKVSETE